MPKQLDMDRHAKSIVEWAEEDFRAEGMLTRASIAKNGHPLIRPCSNHSIDLDQEAGKLYVICSNCQLTMILSPDAAVKERPREKKANTMFYI